MTAVPRPANEAWSRTEWWIVAAILLGGMVLGWLGRQPLTTTGGDDATYILLAESLRHGHYRDIFLPGTPAHAQYPPGLPLMILVVRTLAFGSLEAVRIANLLLAAFTALLTARITLGFAGRVAGICAAALVMLSPLTLNLAGWILSDTLFVACAMTALWACQRARWAGSRWWAVAIVMSLAAFFTRSAGIAAVMAVLAALFLERRWRATPVLLVAGVLVVGGWFLYTRWATEQTLGWSYANDLVYVSPSGASDFIHRVLNSAWLYARLVPGRLFGIPDIQHMPFDNLVWCVLIATIGAMGLPRLWRQWPSAVLYLVMMTGVLLVFPFTIGRLLLPVLPVVAVLLLMGATAIEQWWRPARVGLVAVPFTLLLAGIGLVQDAEAARERHDCQANGGDDGCRSDAERAWLATAHWAREGLPSGTVVASSKPSTFYLLSARQGVPSRLLYNGDLARMLVPEGPVTHIFMSHLWEYEQGSLPRRLEPICRRLQKVPQPEPTTLILRVLPDSTASGDGCEAMLAFRGPIES